MNKTTAARIEQILKNNTEYARKGEILNRDNAERLSLLRRLTVVNFEHMVADTVIFFEDEEIIVRGKTRMVRRLYVSQPAGNRTESDGGQSNRNSSGNDSIGVDSTNELDNAQAFRELGEDAAVFEGVGWIINDDINECMVCALPFGSFKWPHHCRSCGNLVCQSCSPDLAVVHEISSLGPVRVCVQCYWGQSPVFASHYNKGEGPQDNLKTHFHF